MGEMVNVVIFCGGDKIFYKYFNDSDKKIR